MTRREWLAAAAMAPQSRLDVWSTENVTPATCGPRGMVIRPDNITAVLAFGAKLQGNLQPPPQPCPSLNNDFSVAGFTSPRDRIDWTMDVREEDDYEVALLYNGANDVLRGNRFELSASPSNAMIRGELQERWWSPARPWVARHCLHLPLRLKRGKNHLSFHLTDVSDAQARLAKAPRVPAKGAQNRDFRLWSIELVRPGALAGIKKRAQSLKSSNDWMVAGKYGLFTHFSPLTYPFHGSEMAYTNWQWGVELFDVAAYADAVEKTGARWVIFTTSHGMVFWPGPNRTIDRLVKGRTCRRDLLQELARELSKRGIRLCLYFHFGSTDHRWREAVGMNDPNQSRMADNFSSLFEETSRRYGRDIWGFAYIDDGFFRAYQHNPPWERWFRAIKAGNPRALVGFSPNRGPNVTPFNDLQVGDAGTTLPEPLPSRMFAPGEPWEGLHPGWYIAMDGWRTRQPFQGQFHEQPHFSREKYIGYFRRMAALHIPITINLIITQDVTRAHPFFNPKCLEIMQAVNKSVWG